MRNINISNYNETFTWYVYVFGSLSLPRLCMYIWVTRRVSCKEQELLTFHDHLSSPPVFWLGLCCSIFIFIVFYRPLFAYMLWLLYSLSCHLRLLIITFGFFKQLTYVVFLDDNLLIHVNFTHLNNILTVTEYILVTKYIL